MWRNVTIAGSSARRALLGAAAVFAAALIAIAAGAPANAEDAAPIAETTPAAASPAAAGSVAAIASPAAASSPAVAASATDTAAPAILAPPPADGAAPANMVDTPPDGAAVPPSTEEIPPSVPLPQTAAQDIDGPAAAATSAEPYNPEIARYQEEQSGISNQQQLQNLSEFLSEGEITSPIGVGLREARRKLATGQMVDGLLVVEVKEGSPAAAAGLHVSTTTRKVKNVMTVLAMATAVAIMPPAIMLAPLIDAVPEPYDMIIGVDGTRVSNFLDFQDRMQNLKPGETVYFSVVRDGRRLQIPVVVPKGTALNTF